MTSTEVAETVQPTLPDLINQSKTELRRLLPDYDRFTRVLITEVRRTPRLAECTPESFLGAAFVAAQLGLEPGPVGDCWLIPRFNGRRKTMECTFLIGYRGIEKLALRSGQIASIETRTVYQGDEFEVTYFPEQTVRHVPRFVSDEPRLWYAVARRTDGSLLVHVLDKDAVEERRRCSASPDRGPWVDHYDAMARKSCVRAMWQNLPLTMRDPAIDRALEADDQVVDVRDVRGLTEPATDGRQVNTDTGEIVDAEEIHDDDEDPSGPVAAGSDGQAGEVEPEGQSQAPREAPTPADPTPDTAQEPELDRRPVPERAKDLDVGPVDLLEQARHEAEQLEVDDFYYPHRTRELTDPPSHDTSPEADARRAVLDALHVWLDERAQKAG